MNFPENLKYTADHEWLKIEGKKGTVGITDHAQGELGDVVYIDIADDIAFVKAGDTFGTIEAVKTVADMLAPVSGKVIDVNRSLNDHPEVINSDPYGEGWIIEIELTNPSELDELLDVKAYKELIGQ
ncbi:MAG: glycine cleavage system protein H [Ignavibacteria bacterium GWB2_35_12]|nr:MAG: glycine cleavage system protein H [Ignavibacteria bacterium GWA2_35_8]OGU40194.1 MAG: glycine cleavage system protein H [Ignavibacteria bacterium GWB2_35_12]OGU92388.1 MAG: glycine cleavage system protein H [Ignavibacteria bacterium RIFOXYA2_FULL_35_10]OGV22349.1 MAG: glycine cleavage system protein H [Ignavibacteria bacterium RIFOXYC2_FULL_35_21]